MTRSLMTGITGLRTHQQKLDVVANNLANMNTIGYKTQSTLFSDLMYTSLRNASDPIETSGGTNPQLVGAGVQLSETTRNFGQGTLQSTGEILDFAIQGDGFFNLINGAGENIFTRDGSFGVDSDGRLVDPATGSYVRRIGDVGEPTDDSLGFQVPGEDTIQVPFGVSVPGERTSVIELIGNLPASSTPPTAEIISSTVPFETSSGPADLTTLLNDLTINSIAYQAGDTIELEGTNPDGSTFTSTLPADTTTMGDIVNELNTQLVGASAALAPNGTLTITADATGEAALALTLRDVAGNVGDSVFSNNTIVVTSDGSEGESHQLSIEVFDSLGEGHRLNFEFSKTSSNTWDIVASLDPESGVLLDSEVLSLTFDDDGSFALVGGTGTGDSNIEIQYSDIAIPQTVTLDLTSLQHLATDFRLSQQQDGFPPGTISSLSVSAKGELTALASNGKKIALAQLAIANFANNQALDAIGGNFFQQSLNSGEPLIGVGASHGRGIVIGGQLEGSNVDIAQEFTQLIVAQRGFSANARTITVSDEMLEELTNIIR